MKLFFKKAGDFFEENYSKSWSYLKESKNHLIGVLILFFIFFLVGFFIPLPEEISSNIFDYLRELIEKTSGFGFFEMFSFIFLNNLSVGFFSIIFGVVFGIFPVVSTMSNGFVLGYVSNLSVGAEGIVSLWRLLPHGIFELPAIFISFGLGLKFGSFIFYKDFLGKFKEFFIDSLRVFVFIILPLFFIAGVIESLLIVFA